MHISSGSVIGRRSKQTFPAPRLRNVQRRWILHLYPFTIICLYPECFERLSVESQTHAPFHNSLIPRVLQMLLDIFRSLLLRESHLNNCFVHRLPCNLFRERHQFLDRSLEIMTLGDQNPLLLLQCLSPCQSTTFCNLPYHYLPLPTHPRFWIRIQCRSHCNWISRREFLSVIDDTLRLWPG